MRPSPERSRLAGSAGRRTAALALLLLFTAAEEASAATGTGRRARLPTGEQAVLETRGEIRLEALPRRGEGLASFLRRYTGGTPEAAFWAANAGRKNKRLLAGVRYRIPFELLTQEWRTAALRVLFAQDEPAPAGWIHWAQGEPWESVALWFTGRSAQGDLLRAHNGSRSRTTERGARVEIPRELLLESFRRLLPEVVSAPAPGPAPVPARPPEPPDNPPQLSPLLEFETDEQGPVAIYRLRAGEALYSAVVVRFTGRLSAEDVNALAREIAVRSGIRDVTDIPIGYPVKIPRELLLPEYLPPSDPRRLEWEVERELAGRFRNEVRVQGLEGVTVILDAGHGGADVGAVQNGVWESVYVYDVMLRAQRILRERTHARVFPTTRDGEREIVPDMDRLPSSRGHRVLTTPPYAIADPTIGVHLRWYLANSVYRAAEREKRGDRVVFLSIHADSLHPSLRGGTFYIPAASLTAGSYAKFGKVFESRAEVRELPRVEQSLKQRQRGEGLSRELAEHLARAFQREGLKLHPYQAVRDRIYRGRRPWVPAVLRYNLVPARVLVEIGNLSNAEDRELLLTAAFRQRVAEALVEGIRGYFGERSDERRQAGVGDHGSIRATR